MNILQNSLNRIKEIQNEGQQRQAGRYLSALEEEERKAKKGIPLSKSPTPNFIGDQGWKGTSFQAPAF